MGECRIAIGFPLGHRSYHPLVSISISNCSYCHPARIQMVGPSVFGMCILKLIAIPFSIPSMLDLWVLWPSVERWTSHVYNAIPNFSIICSPYPVQISEIVVTFRYNQHWIRHHSIFLVSLLCRNAKIKSSLPWHCMGRPGRGSLMEFFPCGYEFSCIFQPALGHSLT